MVGEDIIISKLLEYLKRAGPTNTFRLASVIGMERDQLLGILKKLEEKQAVRFEYGNAVFIKFVSEEKSRPVEITKTSFAPKKRAKRKSQKSKALQLLQTENKQLQGKLLELKETVKELEKKTRVRPKTITKTLTKTVIKKVPVTKIVVKKVPVVKTVVKRIHLSSKIKKKIKEKLKSKKFKFPKFTFMKNIKKIKKPEFIK